MIPTLNSTVKIGIIKAFLIFPKATVFFESFIVTHAKPENSVTFGLIFSYFPYSTLFPHTVQKMESSSNGAPHPTQNLGLFGLSTSSDF